MKIKPVLALLMLLSSIFLLFWGLFFKEHEKTLLGILALITFVYLDRLTEKEINTAQHNRETVEFESIERKMQINNFDYDKAVDLRIKLLDEVMDVPFLLKGGIAGNYLNIVGNQNNKNFLYAAYGMKNIPYYKIPLDNIQYYTRDGEIITTTVGSGGGSSYSIITGWNGKVNPIQINTHVTDNKHTALYYVEGDKDMVLTFHYDDFHKFKKLLPYKDYAIVQQNMIKKTDSTESPINPTSNDVSIQLKQLNSLFKDELITEEEFNSKRQKILDKI